MCIIYLVRTQADLYIHQQKLSEIGAEGPPGPNVGGICGNAFCPTRDTYIYDGFTALPKHHTSGGGSDFILCLPFFGREFDENQNTMTTAQSTIVSVMLHLMNHLLV